VKIDSEICPCPICDGSSLRGGTKWGTVVCITCGRCTGRTGLPAAQTFWCPSIPECICNEESHVSRMSARGELSLSPAWTNPSAFNNRLGGHLRGRHQPERFAEAACEPPRRLIPASSRQHSCARQRAPGTLLAFVEADGCSATSVVGCSGYSSGARTVRQRTT
jgi:hypothetical protein